MVQQIVIYMLIDLYIDNIVILLTFFLWITPEHFVCEIKDLVMTYIILVVLLLRDA